MHRVLAGAATDFQNLGSIRKSDAQHLENGSLVSLASFGEGQHSAYVTVTPPARKTSGDLDGDLV
jgi:hypothetical protein